MNPLSFIPENAPFTPDQRAWLNGFFSGIFGVAPGQMPAGSESMLTGLPPGMHSLPPPEPVHPVQASPLRVTVPFSDPIVFASDSVSSIASRDSSPGVFGSPAVAIAGSDRLSPMAKDESARLADDDDDFPWHDPSMERKERTELAAGRPLKRQLMAAMAQLDCGACGYLCQTYGEALASGAETCTGLCVPGGDETEQHLEALLSENRKTKSVKVLSPAMSVGSVIQVSALPSTEPLRSEPLGIGFDRKNPIKASFLFARPLNRQGSAKDTRHVSLKFEDVVPMYRPGDALGIYPTNDPRLVERVIESAGLRGEGLVTTPLGATKTLFDAFKEDCCLKSVPDAFSQRIAHESGASGNMVAIDRDCDLLGALQRCGMRWANPQELVNLLRPLQPRLYSISSSPKKYPHQIHLTVARVQWQWNERTRLGVASTMLADRLAVDQSLRVFLHRPQAFALPQDPAVPMIMVGPGTGIAPFIAFLQDRQATGGRGKNWLFFGDQHAANDFLYEDQLAAWQRSGHLHRLETAFSRDQEEKIYVQDRLLQHGREVFEWLEAGAHFYICGDAKSMAASVQQALLQIISTHGRMTPEAAQVRLKEWQKQDRYQKDVY